MTARALVVTVSTRAAAGDYVDRSGPVLAEGLAELGLAVDGPVVVGDGAAVGAELRRAIAARYDLVVTTGGTGLTPDDRTPEETAPLIERQVPGIAEALRAYGVAHGVPTAVLSRGLAGTVGSTLVVNVAGSTGAARDALAVLGPLLGHLGAGGGSHGAPQ